MTLSVCLIVKDEEKVLKRCLSCASKFADEIVVVDTGSIDDTVKIAREFTDRVFFFKWCDDFSAARNFSFDMARCELVMWLDADDVITDENCQKLLAVKNSFEGYDMAYLPYAAAFDGDKPTFVYNRERIFRRNANYRFSGEVHEAIAPRGRVAYFDAAIYHKKQKQNPPMRNLHILQNKIASGATIDGRQKFYYGRELLYNKMYIEGIAVLEDFLSGDGWFINKAEACLDLYDGYIAIGDKKNAYLSLLKYLEYCAPSGKFCCIMGDRFLDAGEYGLAIYWYKTALTAENFERAGAFNGVDYNEFIPCMQLCVAYDRLGDRQKAFLYNERAGKIKPTHANYLSNVKYFERLGFKR